MSRIAAIAAAAEPALKALPPTNPTRTFPVIKVVAGELHLTADEAEAALIKANAPFYVRGGLVQPVSEDVPAAHGRRTKAARLKPVRESGLVDYLSRCAEWLKFDARRNAWVATDPTEKIASVVLSREGEWSFRPLAGVITTPTLRPDGTILSTPGYDPATQLVLIDPPALPPIPERPNKADAIAAARLLDELLDEFPFVDDASRAVALSGLITPVVRGAMEVAPLHAMSAPTPGSGKSYIVDLCSGIATGERAPVISAAKSDEETEKRLGAALLEGSPIVSIDNVNGNLGGDQLCQLIERPVVSVRPLGLSKLFKVASRSTTFATGNNIRLVADMTRRVVLCSLDPDIERPELRAFRGNPLQTILADRGKYVAAALIISRAYSAAGYPDELRPLASFEGWSRFVRSALVWLGYADPVETMEKARAEDPETANLTALLSSWHSLLGDAPVKAGEVKNEANKVNPHGDRVNVALFEALLAVAADRVGGVDSLRLGKYLGGKKGRICNGLKLVAAGDDTHSKVALWRVVKS